MGRKRDVYRGHKPSRKHPDNVIEPAITALRKHVVPILPEYVTTYNLTLSSILWCAIILFAGHKGRQDRRWLYLIVGGMLLHFITDNLDGAVGRYRNTGAIKWGFLMDHSMDILLAHSVFLALVNVLPDYNLEMFGMYALTVQSFFTTVMSVDEDGLDVSFCTSFACIGPDDSKLGMAFLIHHIITTNGKPSRLLIRAILSVMAFANVKKLYEKQRRAHHTDMIIKGEKGTTK